jgi:hypothetical protein
LNVCWVEYLGLHNKPTAEVHPGLYDGPYRRRRRRKKKKKEERKKETSMAVNLGCSFAMCRYFQFFIHLILINIFLFFSAFICKSYS